jgi:hypothetical protein
VLRARLVRALSRFPFVLGSMRDTEPSRPWRGSGR